MFFCCGKVDVIVPKKVEVPVDSVEETVVHEEAHVDSAPQLEVCQEQEISQELANLREEELTAEAITALIGIAFVFGVSYLALTSKTESFYIEAPHDL